MTVASVTGAPPSQTLRSKAIDWPAMEKQVHRLQVRIAKAVREKRYGKVKALQWLLTHSWAAKLLAVRRVTTNKGKETPGVDGIVWRTQRDKLNAARSMNRLGYRPQPLRRVYIEKANGKLRPLGIPTMHDRAMQALYALALEPVAETLADKNSYGFRKHRSTADALGQLFILLSKESSPQWVLDADIKACFDRISHEWLLNNILIDKKVLKSWLKAGYIDRHVFYHTNEGTPQGGIISPILANMTLDGLELALRTVVPRTGAKVNMVRYADDFVITGSSRELLEEIVLPCVTAFMAERGLTLSPEKTHIVHIDQGFDFLGCNLRKYDGKLLIKPAKDKVLKFARTLRELIRSHVAASAGKLFQKLNDKLRGWGNYYKPWVAKGAFSYIDNEVFLALVRWMTCRHRNKSKAWCWNKYYRQQDGSPPGFHVLGVDRKTGAFKIIDLFRLKSIPIQRHVKLRGDAHPFDPEFDAYLARRRVSNRVRQHIDRELIALQGS
jgi:RNA-directed DNA polymerase